MNEYTQKSLGKILIIAMVLAIGYFLYATVFGAVRFNVTGLTNIQLNTSQGDKITHGLTHMWSFDGKDMDIVAYPQSSSASVSAIAGTGENIVTGQAVWSSPGNITLDDDSVAISDMLGQDSDILRGTNFGYSIPTEHSIFGIEVTYERSAEQINVIETVQLKLVDGEGGATSTTDFNDAGVNWTLTPDVVTFGGATELWGIDWTPTKLNDSDFGVMLVVNRGGSSYKEAYVDYLKTTIYYGLNHGLLATTTDIAGSTDGRLNGPIIDTGKVGQGLLFDGVNDSVEFDSTVSFNTLSFWIKSDLTNSGLIDIVSNTFQSIDINANSIRTTGFDSASTTIFIDGELGNIISQGWHHVTITNTETITATDFEIGKISTTTIPSYFKGKIDNIRTYDRVLSFHEIQRLYNLGGTATINSNQTNLVSDGLLANFTFDGCDVCFEKNGTSTAKGVPGSPLLKFGNSGVMGSTTSYLIYDTSTDGTFIYAVGNSTGNEGFIEKRHISNGLLDYNFGTNGLITPNLMNKIITGIAIDTTYMYIIGLEDGYDSVIEKRFLSDGSLDVNFGVSGTVILSSTVPNFEALSIDDTYMYIVGGDINGENYTEKRFLSDGSYDTGFGTSGYILGISTTENLLDIAIDNTYMYSVGRNGALRWYIEKRYLSDGAFDTNFGSSGVLTQDVNSSSAYGIEIDDTFMYIVGTDTSNDFRILKLYLSDGSGDVNFGTDGLLLENNISEDAHDIAIDDTYMYVLGDTASENWSIEKRFLSDGSLDNRFGDTGIVLPDTISK